MLALEDEGDDVVRKVVKRFGTEVRMQRFNEIVDGGMGVSPFMGKVHRHPLTGKCNVRGMLESNDFTVVDLSTRPCLYGDFNDFVGDPYIFKPVPLGYRTWIYHEFYRSGRAISTTVADLGNDLMRDALLERCIDGPVHAGRWSPTVIYAVLGFAAALAADMLFACTALLLCIVFYLVAISMNDPSTYTYQRLVTLPVRIGFFIYTLVRLFMSETFFASFGLCLCVVLMLVDFLLGDGSMANRYSLTCNYKVISELPNRVFVCQREGAAGSPFAGSSPVPTMISGIQRWERHWAFIADISGLLVELHPMLEKDWKAIAEDYAETSKPQKFVGLDIYDENTPTAFHLIRAPSEDEMLDLVEQGNEMRGVPSEPPPQPPVVDID